MSAGNHVSLLALADRELCQLAAKRPLPPVDRKVKPIKLNMAKFDRSWDRKRGAALRLTGVQLRDDDSALEARVCADERSMKTYANAANGLKRELANLRRIARLLDTAGSRLTAVLSRCRSAASRPNSINDSVQAAQAAGRSVRRNNVAADRPIAELDRLRSGAAAGVVAFHLFKRPPAARAIAVAVRALALVGCRSAPLLFMISEFVSLQSAATKNAFSIAKARAINTYCEEVSARLNHAMRASCVGALHIERLDKQGC